MSVINECMLIDDVNAANTRWWRHCSECSVMTSIQRRLNEDVNTWWVSAKVIPLMNARKTIGYSSSHYNINHRSRWSGISLLDIAIYEELKIMMMIPKFNFNFNLASQGRHTACRPSIVINIVIIHVKTFLPGWGHTPIHILMYKVNFCPDFDRNYVLSLIPVISTMTSSFP